MATANQTTGRTIEEIIEQERKAARAMEQTQTFRGHTIASLREAFDAVQDAANWKNPIKATVHHSVLVRTMEAIVFFAGSRTDIGTVHADGRVEITAPGYYMSVGA